VPRGKALESDQQLHGFGGPHSDGLGGDVVGAGDHPMAGNRGVTLVCLVIVLHLTARVEDVAGNNIDAHICI
jgi:hypothetical protein